MDVLCLATLAGAAQGLFHLFFGEGDAMGSPEYMCHDPGQPGDELFTAGPLVIAALPDGKLRLDFLRRLVLSFLDLSLPAHEHMPGPMKISFSTGGGG